MGLTGAPVSKPFEIPGFETLSATHGRPMITFEAWRTDRRGDRAEGIVLGGATLLIAAIVFPMWRPLLIAAVLAGVLSPLYESVVRRLGGRRSLVRGSVHRRDRGADPDSARAAGDDRDSRSRRRHRPRAHDGCVGRGRGPDRQGARFDRGLAAPAGEAPADRDRSRASRSSRRAGAGRWARCPARSP